MKPGQILPLFATLLLGTATEAWANGPDGLEAEPDTPQVYQGSPVAPCGWPTAVAVTSGGGLCTGTLVHPRVVIYAAHCGGGNKTIRFGESAFNGGQAVGASCQTYPGYTSEGNDWAYCVLNQEITQLPIAPVLHGCELDTLEPGAEVAVIGFGKNTAAGGSGQKRWGMTELMAVGIENNVTVLGGGGLPSVCPGDSGGPAMIKGDDGVWRVFGIASTVALQGGSDCGGTGQHSIVAGAVPWIEENSGFDITPCHDAEGNWDPSPSCTQFFGSGNNSYGNWGNWCAGTPESPAPSTCGPVTGTPPEQNAPDVVITSPPDGFFSEEIPTVVDIEMEVSDDTGFMTVWLRIDGEDFMSQTDTEPPWVISNVAFPEGTYEVRAVAEDYWGNQGVSEPVYIGVGQEPEGGEEGGDPTTGGGEEGGNTSGGEEGGDSGGDEDGTTGFTTGGFGDEFGGLDGGDDGSGCACTTNEGAGGAGGAAMLGLFVLGIGLRRRRD